MDMDVSKMYESLNDDDQALRVYCKGLVSGHDGGMGVAICDAGDRCVFELQKPVMLPVDGHEISDDVVELQALIEALGAAVTLGLKRLHVFFDSASVYQLFGGKLGPSHEKSVPLIEQRKFASFEPILITKDHVKFAYKLARDAIATRATKLTLLERCTTCSKVTYGDKMFTVKKCLHRHCYSCMKNHVEAKLRQKQLPQCPNEKCRSKLTLETCKKFSKPKLYDSMSLRIKEAMHPLEKVYCPYCSVLMLKNEVQKHVDDATSSQEAGMSQCVNCCRRFCINCKSAWHPKLTCSIFMNYLSNQYGSTEEKVKSLAAWNYMRRCIKCGHIEHLVAGCNHITCRCGYEFCFTCGAELIKTQPTCTCPVLSAHDLSWLNAR